MSNEAQGLYLIANPLVIDVPHPETSCDLLIEQVRRDRAVIIRVSSLWLIVIMVPSTPTLEQRVEQLEREIAELKQQIQPNSQVPEQPWWEKIAGVFADDPDFEEAVELGKAYRQSLKPSVDE